MVEETLNRLSLTPNVKVIRLCHNDFLLLIGSIKL